MIRVYKNLLPKEFEDYIEQWLTSTSFSWYKCSENYTTLLEKHSTEHLDRDETIIESFQLCHPFVSYGNVKPETKDYQFAELFLKSIFFTINHELSSDSFSILRCKSNILPKEIHKGGDCRNPPHVDLFEPHLVILYYVMDSDGDTFIYEKGTTDKIIERISPEKGKILVFDGDYYHSSSPPQKNNVRIVINSDIRCV